MNKQGILQIISTIMIGLIINMPIAFADLMSPKGYGQDMVEGYARGEEDLFSFSVLINIGGEEPNPEEIRLWGDSNYTGFGFTGCTLSGSDYYCYLDNLDLSQHSVDVCPVYSYPINLYQDGKLNDTIETEVVCEGTAPSITQFSNNKQYYNIDDSVNITFALQDMSDLPNTNYCSGLMKAVIEVEANSGEIGIYTQAGECDYSGKYSVDANQLSEGEVFALLTAYDNFHNVVQKNITFFTDFSTPIISNLNITSKNGSELSWMSGEDDDIIIYVDIKDEGSGLDIDAIYADLSTLNSGLANARPSSCANKNNTYTCRWDATITSGLEELALTFYAEDMAGNKAEEHLYYIIMIDSHEPVITSLTSSYVYSGKYYIGKNTTIECDVTEKEVGLSKGNIYLNLQPVGLSSSLKANICSEGWTCIWNRIDANKGDEVTITCFGEDDLGNKAELYKQKMYVDITDPQITGTETYPEYPTMTEPLIIYVNVSEENLLKVEIDTTAVSENGKVEQMQCSQSQSDSGEQIEGKYECAIEVDSVKDKFVDGNLDVFAYDIAGNKAEGNAHVKVYEIDEIQEPDIFEAKKPISFVPSFIDKRAGSKIPISVFINPQLQAKVSGSKILAKSVDCSETEQLSNTGYLLNEDDDKPYIVVKTATSISSFTEETLPIKCTLTMKVISPRKIYVMPELEVIEVEVPVYELALGTLEDGVLDKIEEAGKKIEDLDKKIEDLEEINNILNVVCTIARNIANIDNILQTLLTGLTSLSCSLVPVFGSGLALHKGVCAPLNGIHDIVVKFVWDPKLLPFPPTFGYFFKFVCMMHSGFLCNANAWANVGVELVQAGLGALIDGKSSGDSKQEDGEKDSDTDEVKKDGEKAKQDGIKVNIKEQIPPPSNPSKGEGYFDGTRSRMWNGEEWIPTGTVTAIDSISKNNLVKADNKITGNFISGLDAAHVWNSIDWTGEGGYWGQPASATTISSVIEPGYWTYDPYKSVHYAWSCLFLPGVIYNWKKERQIECMKIKCLHENAKLGLPIDVCEKAYSERYCLYVESAQYKLHGWQLGHVLKSVLDAFLEDKVQLVLTALGTACILWDNAPYVECAADPCTALGSGRLCSFVALAQSIKSISEVIDGGFIIKPYEDELEGYDYCEDIDEYV